MNQCFPEMSWMVKSRTKPSSGEGYGNPWDIVFAGITFEMASSLAKKLESDRPDLSVYVCQNQ